MTISDVYLERKIRDSLHYSSMLHFGDFATDYVYCPLKLFWRVYLGPRISWNAFIGSAVHRAVESFFEQKEVRISRDGIEGRVDFFIEDTPVELKFTKSLPDKPKTHHELQASIYAWILDRPVELLYITPDGLRAFVIEHKTNPRDVPMRIPMWPWECKFCEYREECFGLQRLRAVKGLELVR